MVNIAYYTLYGYVLANQTGLNNYAIPHHNLEHPKHVVLLEFVFVTLNQAIFIFLDNYSSLIFYYICNAP